MRKLISLTLLFLITILSHSKSFSNDSTVFSCNPVIDAFVKNNLRILTDISRQELISYPLDTQRAIYRAQSVSNRINIWEDKIANVIQTANFNQNQIDLLNELQAAFSNEAFDDDTTNDAAFDEFYDDWIITARLNFTFQEFAQALVILFDYDYNPFPMEQIDGYNIDCSCSTKSDWCGFLDDESCYSAQCNTSSSGCGSLWRHKCNGRCTLFGMRMTPSTNYY